MYLLNYSRHASIDPATRAARGLPEDLIRLCVGIEDPADLLDDLRHALIDAGAITFAANNYVRIPIPISRAVEKLALGEARTARPRDNREWFVSAPGKVILFGEHAVVHGVVSRSDLYAHSDMFLMLACRPPWPPPSTCAAMALRRRDTTARCRCTSRTSATSSMNGT